jgi:hypothetical protein
VVATPNTGAYNYLVPFRVIRHTPTANVTVNLSPKNRLQGSYYWQRYHDTPDTLNNADATFPGFPAFGITSSFRTTGSLSLRSTISTAIVNELRAGWAWAPQDFFSNSTAAAFDNQGGFNLSLGFGLTNAANGNANSPELRNTPNYSWSDQFNYLKGSHSFQFGADYAPGQLADRLHQRAGAEFWVPDQLRPGGIDVYHGEFPGRDQRRPQQRACVVCLADGPRLVDSRHGPARGRWVGVCLQRADHRP